MSVCALLLIHQLLYENSVSPSTHVLKLFFFFISLRENIYELLTYIDCCAHILLTQKCVKKMFGKHMYINVIPYHHL